MISPHFAERVLLSGSDGGLYYATQYLESGQGRLVWYGEHPELSFTNVCTALHLPAEGASGRFSCQLYDLPRGNVCAFDVPLELDIVPAAAGRPARLQEVGGSRTWTVVQPTAEALERFSLAITQRPPTFDGEDFDNMTGLWLGDDGGIYYVVEAPSSRRMIWFGAHPTARPGPTGATGAAFANVFISQRAREWTFCSGTFVDVPRGGAHASGSLSLEMFNDDPHRIRISSAPRGFGLRELRRVAPTRVRIHWATLRIRDQEDYTGIEGDEPMLDIVVARMDGATVDATRPATASAVLDSQFTGMLADNLRQGSTLTLSLRDYDQSLRPVRGDTDGNRQVLAIYVVGWDKDLSPSSDRERLTRGYEAILQFDIDRALRAVPPVDVRTLPTRYPTIFRWFGDDRIGQAVVVFTWNQLMTTARGSGTATVTFNMNPGGDGNYVLTANMTVSDRSIAVCNARVRR